MTRILLSVFAIAAGAATSIQGAANSGLSARTGLAVALVVNTAIVLVATLALWAAQGAPTEFFPESAPWSLYVGGLCGFVIIAALAWVFPRIGAANAIVLMILGQGLAALAIDHFGLLQMPRDPITARRVAGIALAAAGLLLVRG